MIVVLRKTPDEKVRGVLVRLGYYSTIVQAGWFLNNPFLLLTVLEAGRSGCQHGQIPMKTLLQVSHCWPLTLSYLVKGMRDLSGISYKGINSIHGGPTFMTLDQEQRFYILTPLFWGVRISTFEFGQGYKHFSSVAELYLTLCDPMDCSSPGFPVHHQLPELAQTHVHRVGDVIQPSHPLFPPSPPAFNLSPHKGLFQWVSSLHQVAKVLELQLQHPSFQWIFRTGLP